MNYLLIAILILLIAGFTIGYHKGLFGMLSSLLTWVVVIGFLYVATPLIEQRYMEGAVYQKFYSSVSDHIRTGLIQKENETIDQINEQIAAGGSSDDTGTSDEENLGIPKKAAIDLSDSESLRDYLEQIGISVPKKTTDFISKAVDSTTNAAAEIISNISASTEGKLGEANQTITDTLAPRTAALMVRGLAILTSLLLAFIITRILTLAAQFLGELPMVGGFSRILGGVWGVIVVLIIVWLFMDIVTCFSITPTGSRIAKLIEENMFLNELYINNPLNFLISK